MRPLEEILKNPRLRNVDLGSDGFRAEIHIGGWDGTIVFSYRGGWEHCSISPYKKRITPDWDTMCQLKEIFWNDDEAVIQVHPAKSEYVNNVVNCLHLWRCYYKDMVLPPSCFVGIKENQTPEEFKNECKAAFAMAGEKF